MLLYRLYKSVYLAYQLPWFTLQGGLLPNKEEYLQAQCPFIISMSTEAVTECAGGSRVLRDKAPCSD